MKYLSAFLLVTSVLANSHNNDRYSRFLEKIEVTPREIINVKVNPDDPDSETVMCTTVAQGNGAVKCVMRGEGRRRMVGTSTRRRAQEAGPSITRPSKETGLFFSRNIIVEIENVDMATNPSIVFTGIDNGIEYDFDVTDEDTSEGVAIEILGGLKQGNYNMKLVGSDGTELVTLAQEVKVAPPQTIQRNSGGANTVVADDYYMQGGQVMDATGRIYFEIEGRMYACSGTVIHDNKSGRSLILTAAHCVWDDIPGNELFGSNAIFIPNRDAVNIAEGETGEDIHRICTEDVCGCWTLSGGVVHDKWPDTEWPMRLAYDYGFYVVKDYGMHEGQVCRDTEALDIAIDEMEFEVGVDILGEFAYGFGYDLYWNPYFRYCADTITTEEDSIGVPAAWLPSCLLGGGASGGPWIIDFDEGTGNGKVVTVNSWSKGQEDGNGAPFIDESEARCLVNAAREVDIDALEAEAPGYQGIFVNCYDRPCVPEEGTERKLRGGRLLCEHHNEEEQQATAEHKHREN